MPRYQYTAIGPNGRNLTGQIDAPSQDGVAAALRSRGQWVVEIREMRASGAWWNVEILSTGGLRDQDIALIARELSTLLAAGVPLDRALSIMLDLGESKGAKKFLSRVHERVKNGDALSDAMEQADAKVSKGHVGLIRAGEAGGTLPGALAQLAGFLERSEQTRAAIRSALIYPALVVTVAVAAVSFLIAVVLPRFRTVFESAGRDLPGPAAFIMAIGDAVSGYWMEGSAVLAVLTTLFLVWRATPSGALALSRVFINTPVIGSISRMMDASRFCRTLSLMMLSGVPALKAADHSIAAMSSAALRHRARGFVDALSSGAPLSDAMTRSGVFSKLALNLARVGEESGALPEMLGRAADLYEQNAERKSKSAVQLIAPLATILLGAMVASIIVSMMTAMLNINELV